MIQIHITKDEIIEVVRQWASRQFHDALDTKYAEPDALSIDFVPLMITSESGTIVIEKNKNYEDPSKSRKE